MPIHRGSPNVSLLPSLFTDNVQQFSESRASFVAFVSANKYPTTVSFQYNTTNNWSSYTTVVAGATSNQNQQMYFNVTGLTAGTTYYVRAVATSQIGTVTGSVVSFTTWSLKTYTKTTSGSFSIFIPFVTPLGTLTPTVPKIYDMILYGGGGGANYSGGGGGGYRLKTEIDVLSANRAVTGYVGAGGAAGNGGGGAGGATAGEGTQLTTGGGTVGSFYAGGGQPADWLTKGGSAGTGDNTANDGGNGNYGYTYCSSYDKLGFCNGYTTDYNRYAGGGGGGTDAVGGPATYPDQGGNGGTGGGAYGLRGGNGGRGGGTAAFGSDGGTGTATGTLVGNGGSGWFGAGGTGGITFKYYGP